MELLQLKESIESHIKQLGECRCKLKAAGEDKAVKISNYEKQIALTIIGLSNGKEFELNGEKIVNPTTTITEKVAKGLCWREKLETEKADNYYKSLIVYIDCVQAELNALQSLNRHLD